ncbi:hypothetical protein GCM10011611_57510 [Aliidongia dinghuensis]|uniref:CBS domain-containing protein n=1 Tax=Aliidongia dinghuensis TaxID=1867774 RepID=A0A8J2Z0S6_9PROT|nr:CBS domain-containing protein [Aliidongia dinghuensis]GGF43571.1 hypothetical protein GCM10011611_57510 [Aliidongia dinghuensis]
MHARDIMTTEVISVPPSERIGDIAKLLLTKGISAVPVVDGDGRPLGIVSEGDLLGRGDADREARRDWWLALLAEGEALHPEFLASMRTNGRTAHDVMSAPIVAVGEETSTAEIARLLTAHRVKRVPVVRDGRIVGIVSRADLLRILTSEQENSRPARNHHGLLAGVLANIDDQFLHRPHPGSHELPPAPEQPDAPGLRVADFQDLVSGFKHHEREERAALQQVELDQRRRRVRALIDQHVSDEAWRTLLHKAREAAEQGQEQLMLLRFPSELCSDGGRAINVAEHDWPSTLRGEAAELYLRWDRELRPQGFHLTASVLEFPDGKPGDIGMFLVWKE